MNRSILYIYIYQVSTAAKGRGALVNFIFYFVELYEAGLMLQQETNTAAKRTRSSALHSTAA